MKLREIPNPVLAPFPRKRNPDLKRLIKVEVPGQPPQIKKTPVETNVETKPATKLLSIPGKTVKPQQDQGKAAAAPGKPTGNEPATTVETEVVSETKKQDLPPLTELEDGTVIPRPFKPVDPLTALASPNPAMAMVMLRQLRDMKGPMPDTSAGVELIEKLEIGLKNGQDITSLSDAISAHILGDDEHNELLLRLVDSVDRDRTTEILKSRSKWEDFCHGCMRRGDLSIVEGMALMAYWNGQLGTIISRIDKKRARGETNVGRETQELVERVNRPTIMEHKELQRKFDGASPQEREILRKLGFKLEQLLAARITTTKETQTVEIVQPHGPQPNV
jgi:hypothetical protein